MDRSRVASEGAGTTAPADAVLDTVGLYCPVPIIRTAESIRSLAPGRVLEILSDDRVILIDLPAWCRSTRNEYLGSRQMDGVLHLFIRKAVTAGEGR